MKSLSWVFLIACPIFLCPTQAQSVTIYVDINNIAGPWDGLTPATAWTNITQGAAHLATTNATVQGGHTVLVAAGTYNEQVNLTTNHTGVSGSPNVFKAAVTGSVVVVGTNRCFYTANWGVDRITIDGFKLTGSGYGIVLEAYCDYFTIRNCDIYAIGDGISMANSYNYNNTIENCNIVGNSGTGVDLSYYMSTWIRNCNIINNSYYGVYERNTLDSVISLSNNNFYANGRGNFYYKGVLRNTQTEINAPAGCSNNMAANPGFSDLANNWNFNELYVNSPCLDAGTGGCDIGAYQDPPTAAVSSNTYYVSTVGDDSRTKADAQNPSTPWRTISKAASEAVAGDTVIVAGGAYTEDVAVTNSGSHNKPVTYRAQGNVMIDGGVSNAWRLDRVGDVVIEGFGCVSSSSNGVYIARSFANTIRDVFCYSNRYGCHLDLVSCGNMITGCRVYSNTSSGVLFDWYESGNTVDKTSIYRNSGSGVRVEPYSYNQAIQNANIYLNGGDGVTLYNAYISTTIESCDIHGNGGHGVSQSYYMTTLIKNCNITSNGQYGAYEKANPDCMISLTNNNLYANQSGNFYDVAAGVRNTAAEINSVPECTNNIVADPQFVNPAGSDFHIPGTSPSVDAGTLTSPLATDMYGNKRVFGRACDIGSFEYSWKGTFIRIGF